MPGPLAASRFLIDVQTDVVGSMIFLPVSLYAPRSTSESDVFAAAGGSVDDAAAAVLAAAAAAAALPGNRFSSPDPCASFVSPSFCSPSFFSSPPAGDDGGGESDDEEECAVNGAGAGWAWTVAGFASASGASYAYIESEESDMCRM